MFGMHDDAKSVTVAVGSTLCALGGALVLGRRILQPLGRLRATSARLEAGDLSARAPESGPRELRELGGSFNEMAASIERLFDARRELVAWASRDLRTPLASLRAMVEALEDGLATPDEYLPTIRGQTEILSRLVEDLFELAMIDAGALTLELQDAPLGPLVSGCLGAVEAEARAHNVRLEARVDPADPAEERGSPLRSRSRRARRYEPKSAERRSASRFLIRELLPRASGGAQPLPVDERRVHREVVDPLGLRQAVSPANLTEPAADE